METLQDAYRDDDEEPETPTPDPPSEPRPDPETQSPGPFAHAQPTILPDPIPGPVAVDLIDNPPIAEPEPEPKPELLAVELVEAESEPKPESMAVELMEQEPDLMTAELVDTESEPKADLMAVELTEPESETGKTDPLGSEEVSSDSISDEDEETPAHKKQKHDSIVEEIDTPDAALATPTNGIGVAKKVSSKKKSKSGNNVWTKPTSRKGKKKAKNNGGNHQNNNNVAQKTEDKVMITPIPRFPDKNDDAEGSSVCLSKVYKAEKVELSEDRMSAGSSKGYRMVRATRGVSEGAWFFEIKVVHLGETGHTRLGWSTEKGDLQAPVGYDGNSFGYRDIDGCKIHKALREKYGEEGYKEGDVIGCYISLPEGESFAPKAPHLVWYKGQKYVCGADSKEESPVMTVPGSEISFFKNGICQGVAYKDLCGGRYYPAASMYTLPNQPNCVVKFNFGPDFEFLPADFEGRPVPKPMIEVPYHGYDNRNENGVLDENKQ